MNALYTGGCQCGQVRYELSAKPITLYACHCRDCQKQSASAFGMSMPVPREALVILKGQPKQWRRSSNSGREVICFFCGNCGTRLFHNPSRNPKITNIKPGTLDDTSWLSPAGHLWTGSAQGWVTISGQALCYEAQPQDFTALIEKFSEQMQTE